jgi:hypothetical protein
MKNRTFQFDFRDLNLSVADVEIVLGYNDEDEREYVTTLIEEILIESEEISNIRAQYVILNDIRLDDATKSLVINGLSFHTKKIVFSQIKKSESVAIFLCTAGKEIGIRSREAMQGGDLLKGYIYDIIGSVIVESATDLMQNELEKEVISSGKKITNRYNPGYCEWDVAEQHKLFQFFPDNFCGIRLTESALMDPVKSVSGIIGIGKNVKFNTYTCGMCEMKDCVYRKVREIRQNSIKAPQ